MKYFQTVAKYQNLTKAAEELYLSQPSLSKTISRLEKDLGFPLFNRRGNQIQLNEMGKAYLSRVERIFMELKEGRSELENLANVQKHLISISIMIPSILPELIGEFLRKNPNVRFKQYHSSPTEMKEQLKNLEIDMGISTMPIFEEDIEWIPILEEEIFLSVPLTHPLAKRESIKLSEVQNEPFISITKGYGFRNLTDELCRKAGFAPYIAFEGEEIGMLQKLVEMGLGVSFRAALTVIGVTQPRTVQLRIIEPDCRRTIGIALHKRHSFSQVALDFKQFIIDYFSKFK